MMPRKKKKNENAEKLQIWGALNIKVQSCSTIKKI